MFTLTCNQVYALSTLPYISQMGEFELQKEIAWRELPFSNLLLSFASLQKQTLKNLPSKSLALSIEFLIRFESFKKAIQQLAMTAGAEKHCYDVKSCLLGLSEKCLFALLSLLAELSVCGLAFTAFYCLTEHVLNCCI